MVAEAAARGFAGPGLPPAEPQGAVASCRPWEDLRHRRRPPSRRGSGSPVRGPRFG